ncbi:zinc finger protein 395a [Synchiropus splendidus]|uniref:zinc finger protein 395a n=1 Tax=Synchiropus splendidus TaxID=270530 RepID=UPI00237D7654|nr:zinc finger protein 395a [Synchiropus splendidus]
MIPKARLGKRSPLGALVSSVRSDHDIHSAVSQPVATGVRGHQGQKVYFQCAGIGEAAGAMDPSECWASSPAPSIPEPPLSNGSVSSFIEVPRRSHRSPEEVEMDEMMAAMVLSSLSCSPLMHNNVQPETALPMDCGGGELSDSGSSGYWSVGRSCRSPAPSPPMAEPEQAAPQDEGLEMELEQVMFDQPTPRKRRNSVKVAYRCLWPSCGKVLTTVVGIKRHIRTMHLSRGSEHERCSRSEEDFYYTEINQVEPPQLPPSPASISPSSPPSPPPPSPPTPPCAGEDGLSRSAPTSGSFWQVQSEHSYQAPPPCPVEAAAPTAAPCQWVTPPTTCSRQGLSFRVRSVSVGEQWLQNQNSACRRIRGEAKKCRKVYGIEHRDQWCTACRWKKACQRFLD